MKTKLKLNTDYTFDEATMEILNIPKIELIYNIKEKWRFAKLDRHSKHNRNKRYMVSNYGRVYDYDKGCMCKMYESKFFKSNVHGYMIVVLTVGKKHVKYLVHRLVMLAFTNKVKDKPVVNHKDGDPTHNYLWNLEWVSSSENYIHALKTGLKKEKYGEERSNSLWKNNEIAIICKMIEDGHNALLKIFPDDDRIQYERIRTLYKHIIHRTHWTNVSKNFNINFDSFNYAKEKSSVKKK